MLVAQTIEHSGPAAGDININIRAAEETLLDQRLFVLDAASFQKFQELLDAPSAENPKLRRLMESKAPWEA